MEQLSLILDSNLSLQPQTKKLRKKIANENKTIVPFDQNAAKNGAPQRTLLKVVQLYKRAVSMINGLIGQNERIEKGHFKMTCLS